MTRSAATTRSRDTAWRALNWFSAYRLLVALLFVALHWIGQLPRPLGDYDETLFANSAHAYLAISIFALFLNRLLWPPYPVQVAGMVFADILVITLLMYASGGLGSGFGMLLLIVVAGGALLNPGKVGILFAAVAAIAVLGHEVYSHLNRLLPAPNYTHAGFLGITFFITAFIGNLLAARVRESEALARQRAIDLRNLARLNEYIVQHMQSGIVVLDGELRVGLMNGSAKRLLNAGERIEGRDIRELAPRLEQGVRQWLNGTGEGTIIVPAVDGGAELQAAFSRLTMQDRVDILIFLDDVATLRQRAQQIKLASLGRLTASIAHEVRNPLGAISHASQLLSESGTLGSQERRLTAIIDEHSRRVNSIVENIMNISRRDRTRPERIDVHGWLTEFAGEFSERQGLETGAVAVETGSGPDAVMMDPGQLHQVLWNLCENGIRYSRGTPALRLRCGVQEDSGRPFIDVEDSGPGIAPETREHLFEPFFTTEPQGSGLGLYIARELCEANQATLQLQSGAGGGCCFRITLAHPERQHSVN